MDNQRRLFYGLILIVLFYMTVLQGFAQNQMKGPIKGKNTNHLENYGEGSNTFLNLYQKWISPVKGGNKCPMHPSCSQYAKIAFQLLPWYSAYIKVFERLLSCGNELNLYSTVLIGGENRWYDPVFEKEPQHEYKIPEDH